MKEQLIKFMMFYAQQNGIPNPEQHAKDWLSDYMDSIKIVGEEGTPKIITLYSNGNVIVFDNKGNQMAELQENVDNFYLEFLELNGIDPTKIGEINKIVNGKYKLMKPYKTSYGTWNKNFEETND